MMPTMKLGNHSNRLPEVLRALESAAGLPQGSGGDQQWLRQLIELINKTHGTDITYNHENFGYEVAYSSPTSAVLLGQIKQQNNL